MRTLQLVAHAATPCAAVDALDATLGWAEGGGLTVRFELRGDVSRIAVPHARAPARVDGLWRHTCFECFISSDEPYREFNFSPSGEWAAYAFRRYREADAAPATFDPRIAVRREPRLLVLEAYIAPEALAQYERPWRVGLSAVIEERSGAISYWALAHAPGKPDFHHAQAFAAAL